MTKRHRNKDLTPTLKKFRRSVLNFLGLYQWARICYFHLFKFPLWRVKLLFSDIQSIDSNEKLTIILLSYKRPQNMEWIVRSALECDFVETVVISNNNPELVMQDYLNVADPKVEIINQGQHCLPSLRFRIAHEMPNQYFMCIDDDVFLLPLQVKKLFRAILNNPEVPHGIFGSTLSTYFTEYKKRIGNIRYHFGTEMYVDSIHMVYVFTKKHVENFFCLLHMLAEGNLSALPLKYVDDILISSSCNGLPMIHDIGSILFCCTLDDPKVAVFRKPGFHKDRYKTYETIQTLRSSGELSF